MTHRAKLVGILAATMASSITFSVLAQDAGRPGAGQPGSTNTQAGNSQSGSGTSTAGEPGQSGTSTRQPGSTVGQPGSTAGQPGSTAGQSSTGAGSMQAGLGQGGADDQVRRAFQQISQGGGEDTADKLFVLMAAMDNAWETEFSRVVAQKVQDPQIRQLAQQIQQDHTQAQQKLQQVAQQMNLQLPTGLTSEKQQKLQVFQSMSPEQLQTCYIVDLKADHAKAITSYSDHQKTLKNEEVKQFISQALPKLQQHGSHVQQVASAKQIGDPNSSMIGNTDQQQNREVQRRGQTGAGYPGSTGTGTGTGASGTGTGTSGSGAAGSGASGTGSGSTTGSGSGSGASGTSGSGTSGTGGTGTGSGTGTGGTPR